MIIVIQKMKMNQDDENTCSKLIIITDNNDNDLWLGQYLQWDFNNNLMIIVIKKFTMNGDKNADRIIKKYW